MKQYEYEIIPVNCGRPMQVPQMNIMGCHGWELIRVLSLPNGRLEYIFKRPKVQKHK